MSQIFITEQVLSTLRSLANRRGMEVDEILAEAIGLVVTFSDAQDKGYKLLLEKNGKMLKLT